MTASSTTRRSVRRGFTALSPNSAFTLTMPRPRTSMKSRSACGQLPSTVSGATSANSGASSAINRWPRLSSSSASSLLPTPGGPQSSTPTPITSMNTPCWEERRAAVRDR